MTKILFIFLAVAATLSAQKSRPQRVVNFTAGGTANAITGTPAPALAAYSDLSTTPLTQVCFTATATSTGTVTVNLNSLGAKALKKVTAGSISDAGANDLINGQVACAVYLSSPDYLMLTTPSGNLGAGGGGGGGASLTAGYCYLATSCTPPSAALASITPGAVANRVYVVQIIPPFTMTIAQVAARASGGGGAGDGFVIGAFANSSNAPGAVIDDCAFVDTSGAGNWKTCAASIALTAGTPVWLAVAVQNTAMSVRGYTGAFSQAFTEFATLMTPSRIGYCANAATGTGTGLALPATCGALTSESWAVPMIVATP